MAQIKIDKELMAKESTKEYEKAQNMWREFCSYKGKDPIASVYDLEPLKDFVHHLAYGIEGRYDDEAAGQGSVKVFLRETVFPTRGNKRVKRRRKHARKNHFIHLGRQLWENDYHEYTKTIIRVSLWAQMLVYVFSSARLCEYLEGVSRANSRRGLYCKISRYQIRVIRNELSESELVFQVVKDAKGMTNAPEKRPEHELYEGLSTSSQYLLLNPMLPILAMLVASDRLRDYCTSKAVLAISAPPPDEVHVLEWKDPDCPLFEGLDDPSPILCTK
ncbi:hypothetical protein TSTA_073180 [Talaromyces stipitatus ATCC 10500]|uniref:Uncharacterized protein n=1 Tax=Talaromyces stipitatus (strain ATCC 10500 / CBS 375.48 / QM 6759 / NRRL 1006) TaxID=441959 RepID=B8LUS1_TALSN|nr:uncharacterized protein TSTA_073180 [Talaromyces stipitatus ATCC 10500]EED23928.1 hypothetical protein TSTA_073180 [Talaromyces stipitatus ATCC 10500]